MLHQHAVLLSAVCLILAGCSETAMVRSYPPGAKLFVDGQFVGITPVVYSVDRDEFAKRDFAVHLDRTGYVSTDGTLRKETCKGRVTGGVFTLGILFLFKGPTCFASPQDFSLDPTPEPVAAEAGAARPPTVEERLDRIRKMRDRGIITDQEYEQYRKEILKDL